MIGSRLGGIAELVDDNLNGLLIEPNSVQDWAAAINTLALNRALLARLRAGITRQRTMREAAHEVQDVYAQIVPQTNAPRQLAAMAGVS